TNFPQGAHREWRQRVHGSAAAYVGPRLRALRSHASERWTAHVAKMNEIMLMAKPSRGYRLHFQCAGHEEGAGRYFVYNGGTPKFVGIIKGVAAKVIRRTSSGRARVPALARRGASARASAFVFCDGLARSLGMMKPWHDKIQQPFTVERRRVAGNTS